MIDEKRNAPLILPPHVSTVDTAEIFAAQRNWASGWLNALREGRVTENQYLDRIALLLTARKVSNLQLKEDRETDPLTQLPNYYGSQQVQRRLIDSGQPHAAMVIDLRGFKAINNDPALGYEVANDLLVQAGIVLRQTLYHGKGEQDDIVTRYDVRKVQNIATRKHGEHGDEFLIFLPTVRRRHELEVVCRKIQHAFNHAPFYVERNGQMLEIPLQVSIGAAIFKPGMDPDLFTDALSSSLSEVKKTGADGYKIFTLTRYLSKPVRRLTAAQVPANLPE